MIWWPRQMPNTGSLPSSARDVVARVVDRRRIAGTVREEHAVGLAREHVGRRRATRARPRPGNRRCTSWSRIDRLIPKSYATTNKLASSGPTVYGSAVVTSATRSRPSVPPSACAAASSVSRSATPNAPGIAPAERMWRVRRRVSMPAMPGDLVPLEDSRAGRRSRASSTAGARGRARSRRGSAARAPRRRRR